MSALLQMTMETEDTTERLSAPTVPSWNFSAATPISTPPQQEDTQSCKTQKLAGPKAPNHAADQHLRSTKGHISIKQPQQEHQEAAKSRPFRPKLPLCSQRTEFSQTGKIWDSGRRARESELSAGLAVARGPEKRAGAGRQGLDRWAWPRGCVLGLLPPPSPAHRRRRRVFYTKEKKRYCCEYMVISGWWWLMRGRCVIIFLSGVIKEFP